MKIKIFSILFGLTFLHVSLYTQTSPIILNEDTDTSKKEEQEDINSARRKMIKGTVENLSDREVDDYLKRLNADSSGSIYQKRKRLHQLLDIVEAPPVTTLFTERKKQSSPPVVIENAAEGEVVNVDKTKSGVLVLRGNVRLKLTQGTLYADIISVDSERKEVYAEGGIRFQDTNGNTIHGEKFIYDTNLQQGIIYQTKASFFPLIFNGEKIKKLDEKRYSLETGYFTSCNAEVPHYSFKVKKIILYQDEGLVVIHPRFQVGRATLFWFPFFYSSNYGNGWTTQAGKNNTQGMFIQNSYQWSSPKAAFSTLSPTGYKVRADYYEKTGQAAQLEMWRVSPWLNYDINFSYANYKHYQITPAYDDRFKNGGIGSVAITNQVDKGEGQFSGLLGLPKYRNIGVDTDPWWKADILLNGKKNDALSDATRNIYLKYENYTNRNFEYEFGNRYEPANSYNAIYSRRSLRNALIRNSLDWDFNYSENRKDLNVEIKMKRNMLFYTLTPLERSGYFPTYDVIPSTTINNSTEVGKIPYFEAPVYWDFYLNNTITRYYGSPVKQPLKYTLNGSTDDPYGDYKEFLLRTQSATTSETGFHSSLDMGNYLSYTPGFYYGVQKNTVAFSSDQKTSSDLSLENFMKRESYQYFRSNQSVRAGAPILFFTTTHRFKQSDKPELQDKTVGANRLNEMEVSLESYALQNWEFSITSIKDLRKFSYDYQPQPTDKERWYYTVGRVSGYIDFLEGFGSKKVSLLERQRSFFSGIYINNDYVYHTPQGKSLANHLTLSYQMGGFKTSFLKRIHLLEIGGTWYHNYISPLNDNYRYYVKTDIQIWQYIGFELNLDSGVTEPWRYTEERANPYNQNPYYESSIYNNKTSIGQDIINGTGINGSQARQQTAFNINHFMGVLKLDLHDWEYRLAYSMDLRTVPGGSTGDNLLTFYDQSVYFSITLKNVSLTDSDSVRTRVRRYRKKSLTPVNRNQVNSGY